MFCTGFFSPSETGVGILFIKSRLPIKRVKYGDMKDYQDANEEKVVQNDDERRTAE